MFGNIVFLIAGFFMLIVGADQLVKGSSSIAKRYGLSNLFIGLTIVAFGSSAPELAVNLFAAFQGSADIAIGNVVGSNIANLLLGLGVAATVSSLSVERGTVWKEIPYTILAAFVFVALVADKALGGGAQNVLTRGEGLALLGFFFVFLYFTFAPILRREKQPEEEHTDVEVVGKSKSAFMILGGLLGLVLGGNFIVTNASELALSFGVSQALVTLTIVAAGTSLPEIAATVTAAYRGHTDMAIGNIVGSVTFNTLWILGISALIMPLPVFAGGMVDIVVMAMAAFIIFPFMINQDRVGTLDRWEGIMFALAYLAYLGFTIWRG